VTFSDNLTSLDIGVCESLRFRLRRSVSVLKRNTYFPFDSRYIGRKYLRRRDWCVRPSRGGSRAGGQENSCRDYRARGPPIFPPCFLPSCSQRQRIFNFRNDFRPSSSRRCCVARKPVCVPYFIAHLSINFNGRAKRVRQLEFDVDDNWRCALEDQSFGIE